MRTYVESSLQFAITAQLHNDNFVDAQAHEIEGLVGLFFFFHGESDRVVVRDLVDGPSLFWRSELWQLRSSWRKLGASG